MQANKNRTTGNTAARLQSKCRKLLPALPKNPGASRWSNAPPTKTGRPEVMEPPMVGAGRCAVVSAGMLVRGFAL